MRGLLHDAHEGLMGGDFPTPFQDWFREEICGGIDYLDQAKKRCDTVIFNGLGVGGALLPDQEKMLGKADKTAFVIEASQLFREKPVWLSDYVKLHNIEGIPDIVIIPTTSEYIKARFVEKYRFLKGILDSVEYVEVDMGQTEDAA
jgi:hypothetical protein